MERELFRAKEVASQEYIISDSIAWIEGKPHLLIDGRWMECKEETRAVSYPDMLDKSGKRIFAALNESRVGGSIIREWEAYFGMIAIYKEHEFRLLEISDKSWCGNFEDYPLSEYEVTGIYEGE